MLVKCHRNHDFLFSRISGKITAAYFEKFGKPNVMSAAERAADAAEV